MIELKKFIDLALAIQQIPAPTFQEQNRAAYVFDLFKNTQVDDVYYDAVGNVHAVLKHPSALPELYLTAHLDTVFSDKTDISYQQNGDSITAPGIGDNSIAVAALIWIAEQVQRQSLNRSLHLVANICEEGNGNLKGMRFLCENFQQQPQAMIVLEGAALGHIYHQAIGVHRLRLTVNAKGGHSWADYGKASAVHELVKIAARIAAISLDRLPQASLNIGRIEGGTTINTIASEAWMEIDLRCVKQKGLDKLTHLVKSCLPNTRNRTWTYSLETIGQRPAGELAKDHALINITRQALHQAGWQKAELVNGSTDANIPLSKGIPAIVTGITTGGNIHRTDEYINLPPIECGLTHLLEVITAVGNLSEREVAFR